MEEMIAYCGLACHECKAFQATKNDDDKMRVKVAKWWSKRHEIIFERQDINCDGCKSETGRLFKYCRTCEIRQCGKEKDLENCGTCQEYPCVKLNPIFKVIPPLKERLDALRKS